MKLEEVLPAYREGRVVVSCDGIRYQIQYSTPFLCLGCAVEREILGEWAIQKKTIKKEVRGWLNIYPFHVSGRLYKTKEEADRTADSDRVGCVEFVHEYEVDE